MKALLDYYRCPDQFANVDVASTDFGRKGFFHFGADIICYGNHAKSIPTIESGDNLHDVMSETVYTERTTKLSFDPDQIVDNLRFERYFNGVSRELYPLGSTVAGIYYFLRPLLPVAVRKHLQRLCLRHRLELPFPRWPVDTTVDDICEKLLLRSLKSCGVDEVPFIWFWPEGASSCAIMTHDVESKAGRDYCESVICTNENFNIPASFQIVPEKRYAVPKSFLETLRSRGCEVNVQDLNHDGFLFRDHGEFLKRVERINFYGQIFEAVGFRSAALYRRQKWFGALHFQYDMSVPNVGHLDPQKGGCCTVMPYFIGDLLELPVTTTQDYSLFNILKDYSLDLWRQQIELIMKKNGLISFIVHPDYIIGKRELKMYENLLSYLSQLRATMNLWIALPGEVNRWWRQRASMSLVKDEGGWHIEGPGSERACIAYASEKNGRLALRLEPAMVGPSRRF
jgi:hypothetical protein